MKVPFKGNKTFPIIEPEFSFFHQSGQPKFRDGSVLPSVVQVLHDGKAFSPDQGHPASVAGGVSPW
jgi:hypothetical protein